MKKSEYNRELKRLQHELVWLQRWIVDQGLRVAVLFEGRDTAGKGGTIARFTARLNPRVVRTVALGTPSPREQAQWYFQRYVGHLPARGEMVLFDRSWYNRAGVEPVMGFCTPQQHNAFLRECPTFERMLIDDGLILIKYWLEVDAEVQRERLTERLADPSKRWKISAIDLEAQSRYYDYSRARDRMFAATDAPHSPWFIVPANDQRAARLNCISHLLETIPHRRVVPDVPELPECQSPGDYRPPEGLPRVVPQTFGS